MPIEEYLGKTPKVSQKAYIHPTSYIIGDVEIGELTSIWHYVVIRGDNDSIRIGKESNVQENTTIHTDYGYPVEIGDKVTIGHNAVIHGAKVSSHVIVGMGAILLNGSQVGEYSIIGAGSVVTQGTVIPPYSVAVGVPAKVIKKLRENEITIIDENAEEYLKHTRRLLKL
ncbi:DapH/DapD/GlmU-related protein [Saccharolobus islandicus]|uniref:Carbonic anhydrase/acetyltransferase, isoleucine patch superfamily n=2 Tax=Saccharolobus islandicus TaxID=43080 RepID=M9UEP2_SACIS|nr:DapH/DapD/GlmU-related protein [Sulfolobus islandicus]ADX83055.1 ferripyochelin binding protein [Sulfolobus islandicus HVE10/4]AGJ63066.1 Carbonic anhydrase/acetyltransferase, isoleucine patch superfamily [Sulfolobus islandicus LAL14/1]WCM38163.1 gamma carbonic anhydrase family protein [Sulfolobus islandicus]